MISDVKCVVQMLMNVQKIGMFSGLINKKKWEKATKGAEEDYMRSLDIFQPRTKAIFYTAEI